jgi:small-conductance mechanosensitive channel
MQIAGAIDRLLGTGLAQGTAIQRFLEGITSTEGRIVVSGIILAAAVVLVVVVIPWLARRLGGVEPTDGPDTWRETIDALRTWVQVIFTRGLQLGIGLFAVVALVVVWGRVDEVAALIELSPERVELGRNVVVTAFLGIITYVSMDVVGDTVARFSEGADRITDHQEEIIRRITQLSVIALAITAGLTLWGVDLSGLLVGAGFLGIVVGLAARQTLGSLIAGLVLMFSRPFTIGDWVEIGDQEGIVTDITIVNTRLENFDGEFVVIPNDMVGNQPITNRSQKGHLRIRLDVGIDYTDDPDHAREVALDAMREIEAIEQTPPPQAFLKSFGDSAVVFELRFWIDRPTPPRKWLATNAVIEAVKSAFAQEGIKIPYPQRELTGREETGGLQVRADAVDAGEADRQGRHPASIQGDGAGTSDGAGRDGDAASDDATDDAEDETGRDSTGETSPETDSKD